MTKTVYAHTPLGSDFPPFVNLSSQEDGTYTLTVRSQGNGGRDLGAIKLSPEAVEALTIAALADLYGETPTTVGMNFGGAITALKAGERIARTGWNGKGMFVYLVPPASYPVQTGAAKAHFGEDAMVPYNAYMAIKNVDGTVSTWVPSVNDCLASDWGIVGESVAASSPNLPVIERPDTLVLHVPDRGPACTATAPAESHASAVLYPAIERAMTELESLHPRFNDAVNRAFNHLHDAFWSECPAPASASPKRTDLLSA